MATVMAQTVGAEVVRGFVWQRIGLAPSLAFAAALSGLAAISASAALANSAAQRAPDMAAGMWPVNGFALANAASARIEAANTGLVVPGEVRELAERAIVAEPTSVQGLRNLALYYDTHGDGAGARRLMRLVVRLSARDTAANMWLVEDYLRRGDLADATTLIDATLRTDSSASAQLLPGLAGLLELPGAEAVMLDLLAGGPPWGHDFWTAVLQSGASPQAAARLRIALHQRGAPLAAGHDARLIEQLVDARAFDQAFALYAAAGRAAQYPPIDWRLAGGSGIAVSREADGKLGVSALAGSSGVVAQRLVTLPRGTYRLRIASSGMFTARITCAHLQGEHTLDVRPSGSGSFDQPSACGQAWLTLSLAPATADRSLTIDTVTLTRTGDGA
jgi:hypothetical protein